MMKIGIVMVNYKDYARRFLRDCVASLVLGDNLLFIVDNESTAESRSDILDICPLATILSRPDGNYTAANNLGAKAALELGCTHLLFANMDVEFAPDFLIKLEQAIIANPQAGIIQPKILLDFKERKLNSLGNEIHFLGFGFCRGYGLDDIKLSGYPEILGYGSGCALLISREIFLAVGGYNEEYYMYHDDMEISTKVRLAGHNIILAPAVEIWHKYQFERSVKMVYYMERNRLLFVFSFYPAWLILLLLIPLVLMELGTGLFAMKNGWFSDKLRVWRYFLLSSTWKKIEQYRHGLNEKNFLLLAKNFKGQVISPGVSNFLLDRIVNPIFAGYWFIIKLICL